MSIPGSVATAMGAVLLAALLALAATASAQQPPDPAVLAMKLQDAQFLLETREKQLAELDRYWAAYVAGLKPAK